MTTGDAIGEATADPPARVTRRRVYFITGIDPRGPQFYHQMWRDEAAQQAHVNGLRYDFSAPTDDGPLATHWTVRAHDGEQVTESVHTFLRWEDLMRARWPASRLAVLKQLPGMYWLYLKSGLLARTWRFARPFFWVYFVAPPLYVVLSLLVLAGAIWALPILWAMLNAPAWLATAGSVAAAIALAWALVKNGDVTRLSWLARANLFMGLWARDAPETFAQRWRDFAARIDADVQRDGPAAAPDEVLIIGHCGGAPAAVAVAQCWLSQQTQGRRAPVKLLTLGQATPLLSLVPKAEGFREQLRQVGASSLPWLDYTAPTDPLCYRLTDPFAICGLATPARDNFQMKSARFDRMFAPDEYARLRKNIFRIHFQYLQATQRPVDNDYFSLTCGPRPLPLN